MLLLLNMAGGGGGGGVGGGMNHMACFSLEDSDTVHKLIYF